MAVRNAISAIVIVGAMLAAALTEGGLARFMGVLAVALAAVNVFGGFWSPDACSKCLKERKKTQRRRNDLHEHGHPVLSDCVGLLHPVP